MLTMLVPAFAWVSTAFLTRSALRGAVLLLGAVSLSAADGSPQRRADSLFSRSARNSEPSSHCGQRRLLASSAPRS